MKLIPKFKLQKKYIAFLTVVPLLVATAIINVDCPVCNGQGFVLSTPGMDKVRITDIESEEKAIYRNACDMFLMYNYDITLSIENSGPDEAVGWIKMVLIDFVDGKPLDSQYTVVEILGEASVNLLYNVWFSTGLDEPRRTEVDAVVLTGEVPDVTCNGTGKVPLNSWPVINSLKNRIREMEEVEKPWAPPIWPIDDEG